MGDKVDFLPADKHKSFLQDDSIPYGVRSQTCSKYPKQGVCNIFAVNMSRKTWNMKLSFCLLINAEGFFKVILPFQVCMARHAHITQNSMFAFLCKILRKKWVMQLTFCMQISMKACFKLLLRFWWRWSSIPKVPKIASFLMSLQDLKSSR